MGQLLPVLCLPRVQACPMGCRLHCGPWLCALALPSRLSGHSGLLGQVGSDPGSGVATVLTSEDSLKAMLMSASVLELATVGHSDGGSTQALLLYGL